MFNTKSRAFSFQFVLILVISMVTTAFGNSDATVDGVAGPNSDGYAMGRILNGGTTVANWRLNSSVSSTDFDNDAIQGGSQGIQYVMLNETEASRDSNTVVFTANSVDSSPIGISIMQSPYFDAPGTWNGGNVEAAQFSLWWAGGGVATLHDVDDQISGYGDGATFGSGSTMVFSSYQILNSEDSWQIDLPTGANSVTLQWSSTAPTMGSDLTREWVSFNVTTFTVPEPTTGALFGMASLFVLGLTRRRQRRA